MTPPAGEHNLHRALSLVKEAGGINSGFSRATGQGLWGILIWWTDPQTKSTLALYAAEIRSVDDVRLHMEKSRAKFTKAKVCP